jgi:hypothetical protein
MGDNLVPNGLSRVAKLLQVEVSGIIMHEADEPNAFVDFLDAEFPASTIVDPLARQLLPHPAPSSIIATTPYLAPSSATMVVAMPVSDDAKRRRILL